MKQLKKLTRVQKIRLNTFLKQNNKKGDVQDYGLIEATKDEFTVALKDKPELAITIPY